MLKIKLLGKAKIEYDGQDITEKFGLKTLALLSLLLMEKKQVSREKLIVHLWPDSSEEAGKYNLRFNLWIIKSVIPDDKQGNSFLHYERGFCGINDKYIFECDILSVKSEEDYDKLSVERLEKLVAEFSGDFMEGFYFKNCNEYNEIILIERNIFENIRIKLFLALMERYREVKKYDDSMKILSELTKFQPYDEEIALMVMEIYELQNKQSAAIIFYNEFKNRIITCLGVEPAEALQTKYKYLKEGASEKNILEKEKRTHAPSRQGSIETSCVENIRYFWISDLLENMYKGDLTGRLESEPEEEIGEIVKICPYIEAACRKAGREINMGTACAEIFELRLTKAVINLVRKAAEHSRLKVIIKSSEVMDEFSRGIYKYLVEEKLIETRDVAY